VFDCERECSSCQKNFWITTSQLDGREFVTLAQLTQFRREYFEPIHLRNFDVDWGKFPIQKKITEGVS
ncbi:MAG: hypothetical protein JRN15_11090, partial [Nitrososphaerota archaeon]|nr:hypothetical protein [Nitrososphaerota archaeon]